MIRVEQKWLNVVNVVGGAGGANYLQSGKKSKWLELLFRTIGQMNYFVYQMNCLNSCSSVCYNDQKHIFLLHSNDLEKSNNFVFLNLVVK